jgi:DNA-binding MarR family transcriptional regulator
MYCDSFFMSKRKMTNPLANPDRGAWTFLTNHSHVLISLASDGNLRVRDIAEQVSITERAVLKILGELEEAGIITRTREGRRTHYTIHRDRALRHQVEAHCTTGHLLAMIEKRAPVTNSSSKKTA